MNNRVENDILYEYILHLIKDRPMPAHFISRRVKMRWKKLSDGYIRSHLNLMCKAHKMIDECYVDNMFSYKVVS